MISWLIVIAFAGSASLSWWMHLRGERRGARIALVVALVALVAGVIYGSRDLGLQKLVSTLVMPLGLLWVALAVFALWALARGPASLGRALAITWVAYSLAGNGWLVLAALNALESSIQTAPLPDGPPLDAIIVPGGGAGFNHRGDAQLGDYGDRVIVAARLYHAGQARYLVATGSSIGSISVAQDLSDATRIIWHALGIPEEAILRIPEPKNTQQEIAAAKKLIEARRWTRVGLVGSAFHLPRIMALCRRADLDVIPIAADLRGGEPVFHPLALVPSANSLKTMTLVLWETLGRAVGR